jgi:membrane-associated protease RseP (regulator of RpoE activity)
VALALFFALALAYGVAEVTTEVDGVSTILVNPSEVADDEKVPLDLEVDDTVLAVDGVAVDAWTPSEPKASGELTTVTVDRDGVRVTLETTEIVEVAPAFTSGIRVGDVLVAVDGTPVESWSDFVDVASTSPGESAVVVVDRGGEQVVLETYFAVRVVGDEGTGFFGISPAGVVESVGLIGAAGTAVSNLWTAMGLSVRGLWDLVTNFGDLLGAAFGQDDEVLETVRPISPVGLVRIAGPVEVSLGLLALVNVFVGVLNFVPLYPLDGGHFAVAVYEKIRGRAPDVRKLMPVAAAVFLFIVMLGLLGIYFDIANPLQLPE